MNEWISANWPVLMIGLAVFIITAGILQKIAKLAFVGVGLAVIGVILLPIAREWYYG